MTSAHSLTADAIRREVTRLDALLASAREQWDRACEVGDVHQIERCLRRVESIETDWRELIIALEVVERLASAG